ncbi:MAG: PQQ-binding-like beta-propeller repeat protein [Rhodanobacteraceae bacterium]
MRRKRISQRARFLCGALCLIATATCGVQAQSIVWRNDWTISAPPTLSGSEAVVRFGANGDLLMATTAGTDNQIQRLDHAGLELWTVNLADQGDDVTALLPAADGGAYIGTEYFDEVVRIDSNGAIGWSSRVSARALAPYGSNYVAAMGCNRITLLSDSGLGAPDWQFRVSGQTYPCPLQGVAAGDDGSVYVTYLLDANNPAGGLRLIRLSGVGRLIWQTTITGDEATPLGVDGSTVYVSTASGLSTFATADGSPIWQAAAERAFLVPGDPALPVVITANSVEGLDPATGATVWTQPIDATDVAAVVGDAFLVDTVQGLIKLDAASGDIAWTTTLPTVDAEGHPIPQYLALGGLAAGQFLAIANPHASGQPIAPFVQSVDFASGQLGDDIAVPGTPQGLSSTRVAADGRVFAIGLANGARNPEVRLRSLDAADGSLLWSVAEPFVSPQWVTAYPGNINIVASADAVATSVAPSLLNGSGINVSTASVSEHDASTGTLRWQNELRPTDEAWFDTDVSDPVIDAASNAFAAVGTGILCEPINDCRAQSLYKLAAADGSILWRHDLFRDHYPVPLQTPDFALIGNDVLLAGADSLLRLSGADGMVEWTSDASAPQNISLIRIVDDGNIVVVGSDQWAKLDATNGTTLWSGDLPSLNCTTGSCYPNYQTLALPGGDLIEVGAVDDAPIVILLHGDGSGDSEVWRPDSSPLLSSTLIDAASDPDGGIRVSHNERLRTSGLGVRFLSRFDPATGELIDEQALGPFYDDPLAELLSPFWLAPPASDRLLATTYVEQAPQPTTEGAALLDTSSDTHGNLTVTTSLDPGPISPGDIAHFEVIVHYEGDISLSGVHLIVRTPWVVTSPNLFCFGFGATNCTGDLYSGDIRATFDIDPGGDLHLQGDVPVLDTDDPAPTIDAIAYGPTGLVEQNTLDNFASTPVAQSLFHDGFDGRAPQ